MFNHEEEKSFVIVNFHVTQERIRKFLEQFAPGYTGYLLDQTSYQLHSQAFMIRILYQEYNSFTITGETEEMVQQRIQNIFNINNKVKFINCNSTIEKNTFSTTKKGKEDITDYYTATLELSFTNS